MSVSTEQIDETQRRILKMQHCVSIKFHAKDSDGGVFVDVQGPLAQQILEYLKTGCAHEFKELLK